MRETIETSNKEFDTSHWYAIFSGWLIIPAIVTFFGFLGAVIMVTVVSPAELTGFDLVIYYSDLIFLPLLMIIYYTWFTRKQIFPKIIIVYFALTSLLNIAYFINGYQFDFINLAMSIVWIIYFIRSERVAQTFTN